MKLVKIGLRIWIALGSIVGFLGGWVLLAHAPKPASFLPAASTSSASNTTAEGADSTNPSVSASPTPYPTIAPPPSLQDLQSGQVQLQPLQVQPVSPQQSLPSVQNFAPRVRTGGS
jgi:hypothetical protein